MKKQLKQLNQLAQWRLNLQQRLLLKARLYQSRADLALESSRKILADFRLQASVSERALFPDSVRHWMNAARLLDAQQALLDLRAREKELEGTCRQREQELEQAKAQVGEATNRYSRACAGQEKMACLEATER